MKSSSSDDSSDEESEEEEYNRKQVRPERKEGNNNSSVDDKIKKIMLKNKRNEEVPKSTVTKFYELKADRELTAFDANNIERIQDDAKLVLFI